MFLGQYTHTIDSKNRLIIPVRFRTLLSSGAYVTQGFDRNLMVYTTESFRLLAERASAISMTNPEARAIRRVIFGGAAEASLDSTGRILIPHYLRSYAELDSEITIVGAGEYFELWSSEIWIQVLASITDPDVNAQRFADYDLSAG